MTMREPASSTSQGPRAAALLGAAAIVAALAWIALGDDVLADGRGEPVAETSGPAPVRADAAGEDGTDAREVPLRAVAGTETSGQQPPSATGRTAENDLGLRAVDDLLRAFESGGEECDRESAVERIDQVVAAMGVAWDELSVEQRAQLESVDREHEQKQRNAKRDARYALYQRVREKIVAGQDDWFDLQHGAARAREKAREVLEHYAHVPDDDRRYASLPGPSDNTTRFVHVFRREDPEIFALDARLSEALADRQRALKLELTRMGVDVPGRPSVPR